jgi:hypothetical protein
VGALGGDSGPGAAGKRSIGGRRPRASFGGFSGSMDADTSWSGRKSLCTGSPSGPTGCCEVFRPPWTC